MRKYQIETDIEGFMERWLERTWNVDDFVPADVVWEAMLHSAGLPADRRHVWGISRLDAFEYLRDELGLARQQNRYYRPPKVHRGYSTGCYERLQLSRYALNALKSPLVVRPRAPKRVGKMSKLMNS